MVGIALLLAGLAALLLAHPAFTALVIGAALGAGAVLAPGVFAGDPPEEERAPREAEPEHDIDALLRAVSDPLLLVEGRQVVRANPAALEALGAHVVGEDVRIAIRHPAAAELLVRGAEDRPGSVDVVGLGDADRPWTLTVHPVGRNRRVIQLIDRSEGRAAERMRVDFVANASHELRTPLASLIGFIETLEDANGPEDAAVRARFLKIMAGEARRMQRLVSDLMSLSRIEADKHRAPNDAVALPLLAREVADALGAERVVRERIRLSAADDPPPVAGDRAQLSQLLHNLIGNAIKYGDPAKPIRVSMARAPGGMVRLLVADEGEGIAPQHLPRLTERFYRADPSRSRAIGGTGLGLAIVKHIVERHRGRLDIQSTPGVGTQVTVLLPAAPGVEGAGGGDAARRTPDTPVAAV
jgi:two-component system, OmpR family, phosphate regulon sensor histidine kinase PhoR